MFKTKDSWQRQSFDTWSLRDTNEWKPRYDLISIPALKRIALLMERWAKKYWFRNREKWQPTDRFLESAMRHMFQYAEWDTSEDHVIACCRNLMCIAHFQEENIDWKWDSILNNKADKIFIKNNNNDWK